MLIISSDEIKAAMRNSETIEEHNGTGYNFLRGVLRAWTQRLETAENKMKEHDLCLY
jgi:hypothetical protein